MEFLSAFHFALHFAGKPVVASQNVGCFLRLEFERLLPNFVDASSVSCWRLFFLAKSSPKFHIPKEEGVAIKVLCIMHWSCLSTIYPNFVTRKHKLLILLSNRVDQLKLPTSQSSQYASVPLLSSYYPRRRHSLIYDNTPNHNSPICILLPLPRPRSETSAPDPARERLLLTGFMGYFHLMITSAGNLATNGCLIAIPGSRYSKLTPLNEVYDCFCDWFRCCLTCQKPFSSVLELTSLQESLTVS